MQLQQYYDTFSGFEQLIKAQTSSRKMADVFGRTDDARSYLLEAASPYLHLQGNLVLADAVWVKTSP